jgi:hypothetical protein
MSLYGKRKIEVSKFSSFHVDEAGDALMYTLYNTHAAVATTRLAL